MTVGSKVNQTLASLKGIKSTLKIYSIQEQKKVPTLSASALPPFSLSTK